MSEVEFRGSEAELISRIAGALEAVRARRPLVHNITNYVVMNWTANALLAIGAAPVMAHALEEVEEMAGLAGALVLNIGTLSPAWVQGMVAAGKAAKRIPVVLDPVGAGATRYRTETARHLLQECPPRVVRGNASEILALAGERVATRGVDAASTVEQARVAARDLAKHHGTVVAVTGPEDFVTDGWREARIANGHELMARVTGTGCAASALTGTFCAVEPDALVGAVAALVVFGIAGELAATGNPRPGTFQTRLLDALDEIQPPQVQSLAKVKFFA